MKKLLVALLIISAPIFTMQHDRDLVLLANAQAAFAKNSNDLQQLHDEIAKLREIMHHKHVLARVPDKICLNELRKKLAILETERTRLIWVINCLGGLAPTDQEPLYFT